MASLIDTSVWIDVFHSKTSSAIRAAATDAINRSDAVLCEPVRLELLRGVPRRDAARIESHIATAPMLPTPPSLWNDALLILQACTRKGSAVNTMNGLIATIAMKHKAVVVSFDHDFLIVQEVCGLRVEILGRLK